jgi:hypothetical protein
LQKVAAILGDYGFNCIKLADDWQGADFLPYHKDGSQIDDRIGLYLLEALIHAVLNSANWVLE